MATFDVDVGFPSGHGFGWKVCELKSHRGYGRWIRELKNGELRIDRGKVKADEKLDGKYLISTADPTLSAENVALGYKQLIDVEKAFRTLKTTLDLRPLYHRVPERIRAHVLLCWLALLLVRLAESETGMTWGRIRCALEEISLVKLSSKHGRVDLVSQLSDEHRNILHSLSVKPPKQVQKLAETA